MAHWFVTTGRSVFDSSRCWCFVPDALRGHDHKSDLQLFEMEGMGELMLELRDLRTRTLIERTEIPGIQDVVDAKFRRSCWDPTRFRALPAEMATLFWLCRRGHIQSEDVIHLLRGRGNEDAAVFLQHMLNRCKAGQPGLPENTSPLPGDVKIVVSHDSYSVDPIATNEFTSGIDALWSYVLEICGTNLAGARFVLTGGYKGLLIALVLKIVASQGRGRPMFYLHEEVSHDVIRLQWSEQGGSVIGEPLEDVQTCRGS